MATALSRTTLLLLLVSAASYLGLGYFTERSSFIQLLFFFTVSFAAYFQLARQPLSLKVILSTAIFFRFLLLFSWPALSDDYFRFIWDGRLLIAGENPFLHLPTFYLTQLNQISGINLELFHQLNSPHYFTVYPPVCQFIFAFSAWLFPESNWGMVVCMRFILIVAELGTLHFIIKLLLHYHMPVKRVVWYALNPLVIVELSGNLHFEALVLGCLLASIYLLSQHKLLLSGWAFGLAIGVKLIPLIFLPFLLAKLGGKNFFIFTGAAGFILLLLFLPFLSKEIFQNIWQSLDLYFQKFEFNASVYYVFRWLGAIWLGYNIIGILGPVLSLVTFLIILVMAYRSRQISEQNLPTCFLFALSVYFFLTTTVHPWYLTTLAALCVFTPYRYALVWSGAAVLSYATYQTRTYHENLYLTALEYALVYGWFIWEILEYHKKKYPPG
ncbi:hypothetical protein AHMF7605_27135 [Adhaeribacter arboris]|uniref:Mannosyltransferase n=1 Tax=Adhaeribacter arboris TaxID=2072846 RepID=A0A2T2YN51_9BACT|nr:glycosyltransferase family 87 protein [Adhaeribacter arboris]PSR56909.1 hypothetical protein AHMF7605_27135 [Adhaeribacter arboris]